MLEGLDDVGGLDGRALRRTPVLCVYTSPVVDYVSSEREKGIKSLRDTLVAPSAGVCNFAGVEKVVNKAKNDFHAGRPAGNFGPPASLFNQALGLFDYHLSHLDAEPPLFHPDQSIFEFAHVFMNISADIYPTEARRVDAIKHILNRIFALPLDWEVLQSRFGIKPDAINIGDNPFFVVEVKNEAGIEGDASLQAALSYAHIATSRGQIILPSLSLPFIFIDVDCRIELSRPSFKLSRRSLRCHGQPS